ncbi:MAG TPA: hypothetical protein VKT29_07290 [Terriglobales bacterium]|nr:hypothetical protein [Terriglobales bacterium]
MGSPTLKVNWPWPAQLDALSAAGKYHALLLENDRVRVLETHIPAGHSTPLHTHCWPSLLYLVNFSHFIRRDERGNVLLDTRMLPDSGKLPGVQWSEPMPPHTVENVGAGELRVINFELKD